MKLTKESWASSDIHDYHQYLISLSKGRDKALWEKRIANTPMECLAVPSTEVDRIAREVSKGNYEEFIEKMTFDYLTDMQVVAKVINRIKRIDRYIYFLDYYVGRCKDWASTDVLRFPKKEEYSNLLLAKAKEYVKSSKPFVRRVGLLILMKNYISKDYIAELFDILELFHDEDEYYVLMMCSWLICEAVTKCRDEAMSYIIRSSLCDFAINKAISKCRDSYRISNEDKLYLTTLRRKNIHDILVRKVEYVDPKK